TTSRARLRARVWSRKSSRTSRSSSTGSRSTCPTRARRTRSRRSSGCRAPAPAARWASRSCGSRSPISWRARRPTRGLFLGCAKNDPTLLELDAFDGVRSKFKTAVEQRVLGNLSANRNYVTDQMNAVGVTAEDDVAQPESTAEQDAAVRKAQVLAEKVSLWQVAMDNALKI